MLSEGASNYVFYILGTGTVESKVLIIWIEIITFLTKGKMWWKRKNKTKTKTNKQKNQPVFEQTLQSIVQNDNVVSPVFETSEGS